MVEVNLGRFDILRERWRPHGVAYRALQTVSDLLFTSIDVSFKNVFHFASMRLEVWIVMV